MQTIKKWLTYLVPFVLILGIVDYRFHNYFWPDQVGFLRWIPGLAMFDFFSVFSAFVLGLVAVIVVSLFFGKKHWPDREFRWIYVVVALVVAGLVVSRVAYVGVEPVIRSYWFQVYINYVSPILLFFVVLFSVKRDRRAFRGLQTAWMIAFSVFGGVILFEYFTGLIPGGTVDFLDRLAWPYIDPFFEMKAESANWLSYLFGPTAVLAAVNFVGVVNWKKAWKAWLPVLCMVVSLVVLFLTKSYTGIGAVGLILAILGFLKLPRKMKLWFGIGVLVVLMVGISTQYNTRKFQILIGNDAQETSLNRRAQIYEFNFEAFKEFPLEGIGPGNYQAFFRENVDRYLPEHDIPDIEMPPHPHNLITFWWSDLGIFGLMAMLLIYMMTVCGLAVGRRGPREHGRERNLYYLVVLYFLIHGLLDLPYALEENSSMFFLALAFVFIQDTIDSAPASRKN